MKLRIKTDKPQPQPIREYLRDPATDLWHGEDGTVYRLERYGGNRLDLIPVQKKAGANG